MLFSPNLPIVCYVQWTVDESKFEFSWVGGKLTRRGGN